MYHTIAVHPCPDVDAGMCFWLATRFGQKRFPGIETAKVVAWPTGKPPEGMSQEELAGVVAFDVGGGIHDHHNPGLVATNVSSADLIAGAIGRIHEGSFRNLLEFCRMQDGKARGYLTGGDRNARMISLVNMTKGWNLLYPNDPQRVCELIANALDGIYAMEKDEYDANRDWARAEFAEVKTPEGRNLRIGFVVSTSNQADDVLRRGGPKEISDKKCQVVIVCHPETGHVRIEAHRDIDLAAVRLRLVILEAYYRNVGLQGPWAYPERLATCQTVDPVPNIYRHAQNLILSGSLTHSEVEPMRIDRDRLLQITADALADRLPHDYPCGKDKPCARNEGCPFAQFDLRLCREYRQARQKARDQRWKDDQAGAENADEAEQPGKVIHLDERRGGEKGKEASEA